MPGPGSGLEGRLYSHGATENGGTMSFQIRFHDTPHSERVRQECEDLATELREEFQETYKVQMSLNRTGEDFEAHVHVTGKDIDIAATAQNRAMREAAVEAMDRARKQLRKHRDKRIDRHR